MTKPKLRFKDKNGNAYPEWSSKQFDEVFEILQNNTFSRKELNYSNKSVKNIHYGDILINYPLNLNCQICEIPNINQDIDLSKYKSSSYLQNGDVIFADTAEDETVGKACELYNVQEKMLSGLHTIPCRPKFNFASKYLGYFLNSNLYHNQLLPLITGIKVSSVSKSSIKTTEIYYPCLEEQEKIAGFLSKVDELINECEGEVKDLEEQKKGLMQKIFSQQIRFKDSNNNPYPDWEETKLEEIYNFKYGLYNNNPDNGGQYPVYGANGVIGGYTEYNAENSVIIGHMGAYAGSVLFEKNKHFVTYNGTITTPKDINKLNSRYGYFLLLNLNIRKICDGSGQPFLSYDTLNRIKAKVSKNIEEQEKIAKVLSKIDELIEEKKALLSDWQQFKKGLLQQMFV